MAILQFSATILSSCSNRREKFNDLFRLLCLRLLFDLEEDLDELREIELRPSVVDISRLRDSRSMSNSVVVGKNFLGLPGRFLRLRSWSKLGVGGAIVLL